ncbi:hypothetical protein [Chryseobacterium taiwanense]|uniref:Uncharacterized protein n=1 Tax=Chryseobacterium taiwanense TaxID=363331 RepID=A0A0B4DEI0_9FLAO|nr:hypothetical protein [Chryseobacterium taiwanense]KIC62790.1 hypothetical protein RM51_11465 [Chryseobacterium taiwanense]
MKKAILIFTLFLCLAPFSVAKSQYKGLNSFFEGDTLFYSLSSFINSNKIIIVDQNNKIFSTGKEFKNQSKSGVQTIKIINTIPKEKNYVLLGDYIVNEELAVISFVNSTKKKYMIYTFKRITGHPEWWSILSVSEGEMN